MLTLQCGYCKLWRPGGVDFCPSCGKRNAPSVNEDWRGRCLSAEKKVQDLIVELRMVREELSELRLQIEFARADERVKAVDDMRR